MHRGLAVGFAIVVFIGIVVSAHFDQLYRNEPYLTRAGGVLRFPQTGTIPGWDAWPPAIILARGGDEPNSEWNHGHLPLSDSSRSALLAYLADTLASRTKPTPRIDVRLIVQISVTAVLLGIGGYCVVSKAVPEGDKKWAYGALGAILGFWLHN